jgi:anti-sigma-K factor RskA
MEDVLIHEKSAAYALDALDPAETALFEDHLTSCPVCLDTVASFLDVACGLGYAAGSVAPPDALKSRILTEIAPAAAPVRHRRRRRIFPTVGVAFVACAVALLLAFGLPTHRHDQERALRLHGAAGSVTVTPSGTATLTVDGLGKAPAGKTYEAWVVRGGRATPAGMFQQASPGVPVRLTQPLPHGSHVVVTLEPEPGSNTPTLPVLFVSAPA